MPSMNGIVLELMLKIPEKRWEYFTIRWSKYGKLCKKVQWRFTVWQVFTEQL
jgi:hypothetical protein